MSRGLSLAPCGLVIERIESGKRIQVLRMPVSPSGRRSRCEVRSGRCGQGVFRRAILTPWSWGSASKIDPLSPWSAGCLLCSDAGGGGCLYRGDGRPDTA